MKSANQVDMQVFSSNDHALILATSMRDRLAELALVLCQPTDGDLPTTPTARMLMQAVTDILENGAIGISPGLLNKIGKRVRETPLGVNSIEAIASLATRSGIDHIGCVKVGAALAGALLRVVALRFIDLSDKGAVSVERLSLSIIQLQVVADLMVTRAAKQVVAKVHPDWMDCDIRVVAPFQTAPTLLLSRASDGAWLSAASLRDRALMKINPFDVAAKGIDLSFGDSVESISPLGLISHQ